MRDSGHRVSAAVRIVLEALFAADGPVSAVAISEGLDGRVPPLEQSSVYRNLERLQELGFVTHVHVGHGPGLYALARGDAPEYLVCERCGRVAELEPSAREDMRDRLKQASGWVARFDHFPIHGYCPDCADAPG